ncbi:MAG: hypothetical protein IKX06_06860 [Clostridia bacterium]|nr:hypothetical protein [Clostridia bacterium]
MKRTISIVICVIMSAVFAASFAGCGKNNGQSPATSIPIPTNAKGDIIYYSEADFCIMAGEKRIYTGGSAEQLVKDLKKEGFSPVSTDEAESCLFDGKDITYHYSFGDVFTFPAENGSGNIVDEIYVTGSEVSVKGIRVGSSRLQITATLGGGSYEDGNRMIYSMSGDPANKDTEKLLYFYIEDGVVTGIGILANLYHAGA